MKKPSLVEIVARRVEFLTEYQNAAYAQSYAALVDRVRLAEAALGDSTQLAQAVARGLFKLMSYKDEYEVARLHLDKGMSKRIASMFEGDYKLAYHLAPPLLSRRDSKGHLLKRRFGPWIGMAFRLLAPLKGLRGTALDLFGYSEERRQERALIEEYKETVEEILAELTPVNQKQAVELADVVQLIKGFGHVKEANLQKARSEWAKRQARFRQPVRERQAA